MHQRLSSILFACAVLVLFAAVAFGIHSRRAHRPPGIHPAGPAEPSIPPVAREGRVILVTIDGWHPRLTDVMPVWSDMVKEGSWTLSATVPKGTTTAISHAALYTGANPEINGVEREPKPKDATGKDPRVHGTRFRWSPLIVEETLFTAVRAAGHRAVAAVQKGKLVGLLSPDGGEADILVGSDMQLVRTACGAVRDDAVRLVVLHFKMTDDAGHRRGWLSREQHAEARKIDGHLRAIRTCIDEALAQGGRPTTMVVTSDHGGNPGTTNHGGGTVDARTVPWIAVGPGILADHEIGTPVRLVDTAPTVLRILGLDPSLIPHLSGAVIDDVFPRP